MTNEENLAELLQRLKHNDPSAAGEIRERYGGQVRRLARVWLSQRRLGRLMDSEDICQSVLAEFFSRYSKGVYTFETERQLRALLARIATSRLLYHWQKHRAAKRDMRRLAENATAENPLDVLAVSQEPTPSQVIMNNELADHCKEQFSESEWCIAELRNRGSSWDQIADELGKNPDSLRMKYTRAITRVARSLYENDPQSHD